MAQLFTPALLRRGLQVFVLISAAGFAITFFYGQDPAQSIRALRNLHWGWVLVGVALASMDWIGGGLRLWSLVRVVHPHPPLKGMILAGGMTAWASYLTPFQSGAAPMMIYTMRRHGVPVPVAMTSALMTFIATVLFFALAGPLAIAMGAGKALGDKQAVLGLSLYDLFLGTLSAFITIGVVLVVVLVFPGPITRALHAVAHWLGRRHPRLEARLEGVRRGLDQAHASLVRFNTPRGWLALVQATVLTGLSHANKLLSGFVAMRALGIQAPFVDILLLQTLIAFLLYFTPTPGAAGIAEVLAALVMASFVPKALTPAYTLVWRFILSYCTIAFGFVVFSAWVRKGLRGVGEGGTEASDEELAAAEAEAARHAP
jgi:uncharacterized protein (TIRG00374 family)